MSFNSNTLICMKSNVVRTFALFFILALLPFTGIAIVVKIDSSAGESAALGEIDRDCFENNFELFETSSALSKEASDQIQDKQSEFDEGSTFLGEVNRLIASGGTPSAMVGFGILTVSALARRFGWRRKQDSLG